MRIGIDVRYLSHGLIGGVHNYVANFVPALIERATEHPIFLYADTKCVFELSALPSNVTLRLLRYYNPLSSTYYDWFLRGAMARDRLDLAHFPANYGFGPAGGRTVITLHDAINILPLREIVRGHPKNARTIAMMFYLHYSTVAAVRRADMILTVSSNAANEIVRHSGLDSQKVVAIPHGVASDLRRVEDFSVIGEVQQRYGLTRPFVLADALKNPATLIKAWRMLASALRDAHHIVFFSRRPDPPMIVCAAVEEGIARLLICPPRSDLVALYSMANAFVFPSWIEGFGLPVLEAMACGAPVIASNRGSIPEVAGDAALLVDAEDAEALADRIARVLTDPEQARLLRERGFARAAQFSWRKNAEQALACYQTAINSNGRGK